MTRILRNTALGLSLLLSLVVGNASAQHRTARTTPPRAAESLSADEAMVQARAAMAADNLLRFEQLASRAGEHSLKVYVDYWSLRLRLSERRGDAIARVEPVLRVEPGQSGEAASRSEPLQPAVPGLDDEVRQFMADNPGTIVTDLLRRDWILNLGRRGEWATIESQYPLWVLQDDNQAHCYHLAAKAARGEPVAQAARSLLAQTRDLGDACVTLIENLVRSGGFKRPDVVKQLLQSLEFNSPASIRKVSSLAGVEIDRAEQAITQPQRALAARASREVELIALSRLARQDPPAAAERLGASSLTGADRQFAWSQIAAASMRKLDPEALQWTRETLGLSADSTAKAALGVPPPKTEASPLYGDETIVWMARAALRAQDWNLLTHIVRRMSPALQRDPAWVYWLARAHAANGRREASETLLKTIAGQYHFYGQLASEDLGGFVMLPARAPLPTSAETAAIDRNEGFARAVEFYRIGLRNEGNREWNWQLRGMNDRQLLAAAEWACRRKILDRCVNTADRTQIEHNFNLRFISPFHEELKPFASEVGLDSAWVYGLIRQESRFLMDARSSVGASGLMQIMPNTGRWIARKLGVSDFRTEQLSELPTNLRFGTFYLKSVYDDLDSSPVLASAAYNAGPNRSRNWRASLPTPVEGAVFAEIIPFSETRDYVKKVLSNATIYATLFSGQPHSLKQRLGQIAPKPASPSELP